MLDIIKQFSKKLPKFSDGRIDYSNSDIAPVVTVLVKVDDEFLLLKRSDKVRAYQGKWNTIAGYLDEIKSVQDKALEEISEELGIVKDLVKNIKVAKYYEFNDEAIGKTWIINPVLVELKKKPKIKLDWEHTEYRWLKKENIKDFDIVSNLDDTLERALK
ncbi:MAG: NUDIX hydrolase [uncultured bacterium]|nr:MAG: NUDIX hydrolase [uncultured bacterium]HBR71501.1 hypothetical protein [Candidatus Moranbacteria bacterium]